MAISDQTGKDVDEAVDRAAMTSMLNLGDIFELIDDAFDDGPFAQEQFVNPRQQAVFHVFPELGNELDTQRVEELFKQRLRNIAAIRNQLAKQATA